jgi:hypothetical protein
VGTFVGIARNRCLLHIIHFFRTWRFKEELLVVAMVSEETNLKGYGTGYTQWLLLCQGAKLKSCGIAHYLHG